MILGTFTSKVTPGRRIAIPKKIREKLGKQFIVAKWYEDCIVIVSTEDWSALLDKLTGRSEIVTSAVRDTDRFILGSAFEAECDSQGRVLIPQSLYKHAGLSGDVFFIGLGDRAEIWDSRKWEEREEYLSKNAGRLLDEIAKDK